MVLTNSFSTHSKTVEWQLMQESLWVQKLLIKLWFSNSHSKSKFSLYYVISVVDKRLKNISTTLDIKRLLRSISEHLKYWEANEQGYPMNRSSEITTLHPFHPWLASCH